MAYETKVILTLLAQQAAQAKSLREMYKYIAMAANAEGLALPTYDDMKKALSAEREASE